MPYPVVAKTYTWWRGDDLPSLPPLPELRCEPVTDVPFLAKLHQVEPARIEMRLADANTAYVAMFEDEPAGYGWSGAHSVGVADIYWPIPPSSRGLWDFCTLDAWRGRGIYPHLLQAILRSEQTEAEKFWIGHRADNLASKRGIEKAGFQLANYVVFTPDRQIRLTPRGELTRSYEDPQGLHTGFIEVAEADLTAFEFENFSDKDLKLS